MSKKDKKKHAADESKKAVIAWPVSGRQNAVSSIPPEEQVSINEKIYNKGTGAPASGIDQTAGMGPFEEPEGGGHL